MHIQLLVGLFCCRHHPEAVSVVVGDRVEDVTAGKSRDVDVTVVRSASAGVAACTGLEVKAESEPLDITRIESLACKLNDMPSLTTRGVVSTSGFTSGAKSKAHAHGLGLYHLLRSSGSPSDVFPGSKMQAPKWTSTAGVQTLWDSNQLIECKLNPDTVDRSVLLECIRVNAGLVGAGGDPDSAFPTISSLINHLAFEAQGHFGKQIPEPVQSGRFAPSALSDEPTVLERQPATVRMRLTREVFAEWDGHRVRVEELEFSGTAVTTARRLPQEVWVMRGENGEPFAGASISPLHSGSDQMVAFMVSPRDSLIVPRLLSLTASQLNAINRLRLK